MRQAAHMGKFNARAFTSTINSSLTAIAPDDTVSDATTEELESQSLDNSQSFASGPDYEGRGSTSEDSTSQTSSQILQIVQGLAVDPHERAPRASRNVHGESRAARNEHGQGGGGQSGAHVNRIQLEEKAEKDCPFSLEIYRYLQVLGLLARRFYLPVGEKAPIH
jgi:hypothetical protein